MSMIERLRYSLEATDGLARAGVIETRRGKIHTPVFMPVGTQGTVKALSREELQVSGAEIILGNTYHLYLRPGLKVMETFGGLHRFAAWDRPILTDSGGYQFFSLSHLAKFSDEGVRFRSHHDGSRHVFTPERVIEVQRAIGSDIMMVLDQCPALPATRWTLDEAVNRSTAWAERSLRVVREGDGALFAISQGGTDIARRLGHIERLSEMQHEGRGFDGIALGGLAVGESPSEMYDTIEACAPTMPSDRPRYLMGVGRPIDLLEAIGRGVDMFDCVMPTRNARNGQVFTSSGKLNMRNARFGTEDAPVDGLCSCSTCRTYSRGYVSHLIRAKEALGIRLTSIHNVHYYLSLVRGAREAIINGMFDAYKARAMSGWAAGENS
ncbi:MAG: queuine tRNA-ribosyltransferase [Bradymonadia bacterium]|jgi:queuine tRNA-ribosyltransferase